MNNLQNSGIRHVEVDGITVQIEGGGQDTILMIHGWPDTLALWDSSVAALKGQYRCARFTLPGYDKAKASRAMSVAEMTALIAKIVETISPQQPVVVMCHDWGCFFGYEFVARHPHKVQRLVGVDIGDTNRSVYTQSLSGKQKAMIWSYQMWLAVAWKIGESISGGLGTRMTRWMAKSIGYRGPVEPISWQMCYPYAMRWMGVKGGFTGTAPMNLTHPTLFIYGVKKPFMFHSAQFLDQISAHQGSESHGLPTGHWVMVQRPEAFTAIILQWLNSPS